MHKPINLFLRFACVALTTLAVAASEFPGKKDEGSGTSNKETQVSHLKDLGTEKLPLIIKPIPQEKSPEEAEKEAYERGEKRSLDRDMTTYTGTTTFVTIGLLLVAILQAMLFFWQLRIMKRALADSNKVTDAAVTSANAERESVDIARQSMIASERAYMHHEGIRYISHLDPEKNRIYWRFHPLWKNSGNTPTRGLRVFIKYELLDTLLPDDYLFEIETPTPRHTHGVAPGGIISSGMADFFGDDLNAVKAGKKHLYVWGVASYQSVFKEAGSHVTKFCVKATNITGDPIKAWDPNEPFGIEFIHYERHNCADEDCST